VHIALRFVRRRETVLSHMPIALSPFRFAPMRAALACAAAAFAVAQPASGAEPLKAALVVTRDSGAEDCPDGPELAKSVEHLSHGTTVLAGSGHEVHVLLYIALSHAPDGYRAAIRSIGTSAGSRVLNDVGPGCRSLADGIAVTLAILLDGVASELAAQRAPPAVAPIAEPAPPAEPSPPDPRASLEAGGGAAFALLRHPVPTVYAGFDAWLGRELSLGAGLRYLTPDIVSAEGGELELRLTALSARFCAVALGEPTAFALRACIEPSVGLLQGRGRNFDDARTQRAVWPALSAGAMAHGAWGARVGWWAEGFATVPLTRTAFAVEVAGAPTDIFRVPSLGVLLNLGLRVVL
jgi:hypothetical protein